jgi:hypothetical protein
MNEAEWVACKDPQKMLDFLHANGGLSDRKQRLFDCACVRRIWHLLVDENGRRAVDVAEHFADGLVNLETLRKAQAIVLAAADIQATRSLPGTPNSYAVLTAAAGAAWEYRSGTDPLGYAALVIAWEGLLKNEPAEQRTAQKKQFQERNVQAAMLREVVYPFGPANISHFHWVTDKARTLAQRIYDNSFFDRLPELADTLVQAGCDNAKLLGHCWLPGPHVRGCWVLDSVLDKE